ncbi:MAG: DUF3486 family protein [Oscillospiraceae bacterium]|nr:DUF3486 family protein [Oscillospiraceae bacterium]
MGKKKNRKHSIIDSLPADLKEAVDEMLRSNFTYREIVDYIRNSGTEISMSSVQRYAAGLNETLQSLRMAQENFRAIMDETEKYQNLDVTDGILRLLSSQIFDAINKMPSASLESVDFETLTKNAVALTRAAAYKKNLELKNKEIIDVGSEQFQSLIFEAMSKEEPDLYKKVKKFLKEKKTCT